MKHFTVPSFWNGYEKLPANVKTLADKNFNLMKEDPYHSSLHMKKIGRFRSVRIGLNYRALAVEIEHSVLWFWIGHHTVYDKILKDTR